MTAYGQGLRPVTPYGGVQDASARPSSPLCPHSDPPPAWLYWGYHCTQDAHLRRTYGITCADYWLMHEAQGGACGGCGKRQRNPALVVDHDHDPPYEIRGLLCTHCNRSLSRGLARYLAQPPARKVGPFLVPPERAELTRKHREDIRARAKAAREKKASKPKAAGNGSAATYQAKLRAMTKGGS